MKTRSRVIFAMAYRLPPFAWLTLALALCAGAFRIAAQSPWCDEVHTLMTASSGFVDGLRTHLSSNVLPAHPALAWVFTLGGRSLLGGRVLSLLSFCGAAYFFYLCATRLLSPRAALFALALFAVNPLLIWHAQDARQYMMLVLFCLWSLHLLLRVMKTERGGLRALFGATLCGFLTHVYFAAFVGAMGLHLLLHHREPRARRAFVVLVASGLTAAPVIVALMVFSHGVNAGHSKVVDIKALAYTMLTFGSGYAFGASSEELHGPVPMAAMAPYVPAVAASMLAFWSAIAIGMVLLFRDDRRRCLEILGYAVLPILLPFVVACVVPSITFNVRYVLPALPALLLFAAHACGQVANSPARLAALLVFPVELHGLGSHYLDRRYWKEDYAAVAHYLAQSATPEDTIIAAPYPGMLSFMLNGREVGILAASHVLESSPRVEHRTFYVINRPWISDPDAQIRTVLRQDPSVHVIRFQGFDVFVR